MILERGNMWDMWGRTDMFVVTTNPIVRRDGAVVMGRGLALQAANRFPRLPYDFGKILKSVNRSQHPEIYNFGEIGRYVSGQKSQLMGYFMVKHHWRDAADLNVIHDSVTAMLHYMRRWLELSARIDMNFPGIGNGRLRREDVLPEIEALPDSVHVWEYK